MQAHEKLYELERLADMFGDFPDATWAGADIADLIYRILEQP